MAWQTSVCNRTGYALLATICVGMPSMLAGFLSSQYCLNPFLPFLIAQSEAFPVLQ